MKRLLLLTLAAAAVISLVAVMGLRSLGGSDTASADVGTGTPHVEIDLVKESGTEWCDPVTTTASRVADGSAYQVAVCLSDAEAAPGGFQFDFIYDPDLNTCDDLSASALDDNPDANAGTTTFSTPDLGTGWNCNVGDVAPPVCAKGSTPEPGRAFIKCMNPSGTYTLPHGAGVSAPLAVVTLKATAVGTDNLNLVDAHVVDPDAGAIVDCGLTGGPPCYGATEEKTAPPTDTPTPTPPPECDIGVSTAIAANPPALNMKVGDTAQIVDLSETWTNYGATVHPEAAEGTCNFAIAMGAAMFVDEDTQVAIDPTKLAVRMVPVGNSGPPYGDVCLRCTATQGNKSIGDCLNPLLGAKGRFDPVPTPDPSEWTYEAVSCQEDGYNPALPMDTTSIADGACRDGIDNEPAGDEDGLIDWVGFSAAPDPDCVSVQAVGLIPLARTMLAPDASATKTRQVEVQCLARGIYPLFVFGGNSQAADTCGACSHIGATDLNAANNSSGGVIMVTCTAGPEMVKDANVLAEGIQTSANIWLMDTEFGGKTSPEALPAADDNGCVIADEGKGCLAVDVWLKSAGDDDDPNDSDLLPECLGAWEHQVRFDHKILSFVNELDPVGWLESEGRIANCSISILAENWILEGCTTTDGPESGMQVGPCGDGIIERMLLVPQTNDLIYRGIFRPTKDNGVVTNIVDDNCEITDIYAEPMADTLPGGLTPVCGDLSITVRMLEGDTDLDCDVDVVDDTALAMRYGASFGLQLYDQWFDLEPKYVDQDIDIKDLQFVFGRNGSTCQAPIPDDQSAPIDPGQP